MKVLLAGATGALGVPLVQRLAKAGHEVTGITRTEEGAGLLWDLGASSVIADALDRDGLLRALKDTRVDAVIHQLTALKRPPMRARDVEQTNRLRVEGTANLLAAAAQVGARRFVTQSFFGGYGFHDGSRLLTEEDRFAPPGGKRFDPTWQALRSTEQQVLEAPGVEGIVLRYGGFYGPASIGQMLNGLRKRQVPVPRDGGAYASLVYIEDAAAATVAALDRSAPGQIYNIVDDEPVRWGVLVDALATTFDLPKPWRVPGALLRVAAPYLGGLMTRQSLRLSNAKAKTELGWRPTVPTYREGIEELSMALNQADDGEKEGDKLPLRGTGTRVGGAAGPART